MPKLVLTHAPWGILIGATERGRDWGPRLAARLSLGLTGDAIDMSSTRSIGWSRSAAFCGGNIVTSIYSKTFPQMATVRPGVLKLAAPSQVKDAEIWIARPELSPPKPGS